MVAVAYNCVAGFVAETEAEANRAATGYAEAHNAEGCDAVVVICIVGWRGELLALEDSGCGDDLCHHDQRLGFCRLRDPCHWQKHPLPASKSKVSG